MVRRTVALLVMCLALAGLAPATARADSREDIDAGVDRAVALFARKVRGGDELLARARGVLVFPTVVKAGFGFGGQYGEGALLVGRRTAGYYNIAAASFGLQIGLQSRTVIILFMTDDALYRFQRVAGWNIGVDAAVTVVVVGAGGAVNINTLTDPVLGFVLDVRGLMYNLTLEGSKVTRISR